jgi:hypothetical protein
MAGNQREIEGKAVEIFEILKEAHGDDVISGAYVFEWRKRVVLRNGWS